MSINKLALIRYKTIDNCLQNRFRKWTLEDLMEACSDAVYEYEGITTGVSRRTVQLDIQNMRSEKLGYNAPIIVTDKKYYSYEEKHYSIHNTPVTKQDLSMLNEVLGVLNQFKGFGYFEELTDIVTRLEDKLYQQQHKGKSYIEFEKNELLKGLQFIDPVLKSIMAKQMIAVQYKSFKAKAASTFSLSPYLLKEYRNRWFVLGRAKQTNALLNLALDRIENVSSAAGERFQKPDFDVNQYYHDVIGVTKMPNQRAQTIVLKIVKEHAPYIITKPLHPSQKILKEEEDGVIFSIQVIWNFELEREILGFADQVVVLAPKRLKNKIQERMHKSIKKYKELNS